MARQRAGVEKIIAHRNNTTHRAGGYQFLANDFFGVARIGGGAGHNKTRAAGGVKVMVKILYPQIVAVVGFGDADVFKQPQVGFNVIFVFIDFVDVKGRIGHHKVALANQVVRVGVKAVAFDDFAFDAVDGQVHLRQQSGRFAQTCRRNRKPDRE